MKIIGIEIQHGSFINEEKQQQSYTTTYFTGSTEIKLGVGVRASEYKVPMRVIKRSFGDNTTEEAVYGLLHRDIEFLLDADGKVNYLDLKESVGA